MSKGIVGNGCVGAQSVSVLQSVISGYLRDAKKVSVARVGRLREWFSYNVSGH